MSYIGNTVQNQNYVPAIDYFNGDGSTVAFTLSRPVASVAAVQAVISNVPQNPGSAFTVSGSTITFTSAPPSGTNNIYVYYTSPNTQVVQPGQGTVGTTQLQSDLTLTNPTYTGTLTGGTGVVNIGSGQVYKDASGNVGIGAVPTSTNRLEVSSAGTTRLVVVNTANSVAGRLQTESGDFLIQTDTNHPIYFATANGAVQMSLETNGDFKCNSGYGSRATAYGCRAWVNFNGTGTVAIRASGNVSSITDNGTGDYTINFSTAMPDANYVFGFGGYLSNGSSTNAIVVRGDSTATSSTFRAKITTVNLSQVDWDVLDFTFHR